MSSDKQATPREVIELLRSKVEARPAEAERIDASYRFELDGDDGGQWTLDLRPPVRIVEAAEPAECIIQLTADDFVALFEGRANGQQLFFSGRLRIQGDLQQVRKLKQLTKLLSE